MIMTTPSSSLTAQPPRALACTAPPPRLGMARAGGDPSLDATPGQPSLFFSPPVPAPPFSLLLILRIRRPLLLPLPLPDLAHDSRARSHRDSSRCTPTSSEFSSGLRADGRRASLPLRESGSAQHALTLVLLGLASRACLTRRSSSTALHIHPSSRRAEQRRHRPPRVAMVSTRFFLSPNCSCHMYIHPDRKSDRGTIQSRADDRYR
ncbi:hypothetical protein C8Q80DRAFT_913102 [Daedaleopsis nitida]|nr:hypothetical protein C8Q80DRAFT_913102 [Daedaleopsis nitida]